MKSPEQWLRSLFASDQEATNFSAHFAWSTMLPLLGFLIHGPIVAILFAGLWISYSILNEVIWHGQTEEREFLLDMVSRIISSAIIGTLMVIYMAVK